MCGPFKEVPKKLTRPLDCVVEGEVYLTRSGFAKLNADARRSRARRSLQIPETPPRVPFANSIQRLPRRGRSRAFIYDVAASSEALPETQTEELEYLEHTWVSREPRTSPRRLARGGFCVLETLAREGARES